MLLLSHGNFNHDKMRSGETHSRTWKRMRMSIEKSRSIFYGRLQEIGLPIGFELQELFKIIRRYFQEMEEQSHGSRPFTTFQGYLGCWKYWTIAMVWKVVEPCLGNIATHSSTS